MFAKNFCAMSLKMLAHRLLYILCAVCLGRTVAKAMKDQIRVHLPFEIKEQAVTLKSEVIRGIVDKHMAKGAIGHLGCKHC
jgi:hypothetical protein